MALNEYAFRYRSESNLLCQFTKKNRGSKILIDLLRPRVEQEAEEAIFTLVAPKETWERFLKEEFGKKYGTFDVISSGEEHASVRVSTHLLPTINGRSPMGVACGILGYDTIFLPLVVVDGYVHIRFLSPSPNGKEKMEQLIGTLRGRFPPDDFTVYPVRRYAPERAYKKAAENLSPRQEEVMAKAVEMGYYDEPRRCTLEDLARAFGISKAAVHKHLSAAEKRMIRTQVE